MKCKLTIEILTHVNASKTTFAEQVLYHIKNSANTGIVRNKSYFLDSYNIEKEREITVFSDH